MEELKKLKARYESVCQAHACLVEALELLDTYDTYDVLYRHIRSSAIQSFEFTIDTFWKFIKEYMAYKNHTVIENPSPRKIFLEAAAQGFIPKNMLPAFLRMIDDRNLTSHTYREILANEIRDRLPEYCRLLDIVLGQIKVT